MPHLADVHYPLSPLNRPPEIVSARDGRVVSQPGNERRSVCIYGAGIGKGAAPLMEPEWEVWGLNLVPPIDANGCLRADRWFDIHQRIAQTPDDLRWIANCPVPMYVPDDLLDAGPMCVRFPLERVNGPGGPLSCTFCYQIALALYEGFTTIGLYGVELAYGTRRERTVEWAATNWWMGYAEAKGVTFALPDNSRLGAHPFNYGLDYVNELADTKAYTDLTLPPDDLTYQDALGVARATDRPRGIRAILGNLGR